MKRSLWLLMLFLLVGSFVVAWSAHHTSAGSSGESARPPAAVSIDIDRIAASGHVDVDKGVVQMYPRHPGLVIKVADENQRVKAGDVLLQIDDKLARLQLDEARFALKEAEALLRQAELLQKKYPLQLQA